jgi:hypothetical protein
MPNFQTVATVGSLIPGRIPWPLVFHHEHLKWSIVSDLNNETPDACADYSVWVRIIESTNCQTLRELRPWGVWFLEKSTNPCWRNQWPLVFVDLTLENGSLQHGPPHQMSTTRHWIDVRTTVIESECLTYPTARVSGSCDRGKSDLWNNPVNFGLPPRTLKMVHHIRSQQPDIGCIYESLDLNQNVWNTQVANFRKVTTVGSLRRRGVEVTVMRDL